MDSISEIPQQPQLGRLAQFLRYLETQNAPEFLPKQLDVMGLVRQLALPQASTVENLSYGNFPFAMAPEGTGSLIPQVKTGRKAEVADLVSMLTGGVPGAKAVADVGTKLSNETADAIVRAITRNPQATATGVIQETAMPFMQAVAPKVPSLLETPVKSDLGFYSALEQATIPLQNKGTGSQYLAQIEKTAGVKPEEVKWTGLDEFLKSKPSVTKQEVQDYLAANRVDLQEVRLGEPEAQIKFFNQNQIANAGFNQPGYVVYDRNGRFIDGPFDELIDAELRAERVSQQMGSPKFSQYTLPGGENYREILLTLPVKPSGTRYEVRPRKTSGESAIFDTETNQLIAFGADQGMYREADRLNRELSGTQLYRSSHFDQPNILAHMRVNDRVVDGKKTLFIEEVQSDWHQAGRKKGYKGAFTDLPKGYTIKETPKESGVPYYEVFDPNGNRINAAYNRQGAINGAVNFLNDTVGGVPDAPFKTTWHELALKRAIQEASEKGYDRIAFTTGKTQAERYDLSKQISRVNYTEAGVLRAYDKNGEMVLSKKLDSPDQIEDYIGKEPARKLLEKEPGKVRVGVSDASEFNGRELSGVDLKVGGEGMKGFYDQILPKTLDKLGKKFDAKVGKTTMDDVEVWSMDITPQMRESVLSKGQPLFQFAPAIPAAGLLGDQGE